MLVLREMMVVGLILVAMMITYEWRKEDASEILLDVVIGRGASMLVIWIAIAIIAGIFPVMKTILSYVLLIGVVVWFILYLKNAPTYIKRRIDKIKDFIDRK